MVARKMRLVNRFQSALLYIVSGVVQLLPVLVHGVGGAAMRGGQRRAGEGLRPPAAPAAAPPAAPGGALAGVAPLPQPPPPRPGEQYRVGRDQGEFRVEHRAALRRGNVNERHSRKISYTGSQFYYQKSFC